MTKTHSTLPAPAAYCCGGCHATYTPENIRASCNFIGRGDELQEGDRRLAYYNCRCDKPGTFTLVEEPPIEEPIENLRSVFAYRTALLEATLDTLPCMHQVTFQRMLKQRITDTIDAGQLLMTREVGPEALALCGALIKLLRHELRLEKSLRLQACR